MDWRKGNIDYPKADSKAEAESKLTPMEESRVEIMVTNSIKLGLEVSLELSRKVSLGNQKPARREGCSALGCFVRQARWRARLVFKPA